MNRNLWTSTERLYLDSNGKVVGANDPAKAELLVAAGGTIPMDRAVALGLVDEPATKAIDEAPATKDVKGPTSRKAK